MGTAGISAKFTATSRQSIHTFQFDSVALVNPSITPSSIGCTFFKRFDVQDETQIIQSNFRGTFFPKGSELLVEPSETCEIEFSFSTSSIEDFQIRYPRSSSLELNFGDEGIDENACGSCSGAGAMRVLRLTTGITGGQYLFQVNDNSVVSTAFPIEVVNWLVIPHCPPLVWRKDYELVNEFWTFNPSFRLALTKFPYFISFLAPDPNNNNEKNLICFSASKGEGTLVTIDFLGFPA